MALFFMISGWCFNDKYYDNKVVYIRKRAISLLLPWFLLKFSFWFIKVFELSPQIIEYSVGYSWLGTTWFLPALFMAGMISFISSIIIKQILPSFIKVEWVVVIIIFVTVHILSVLTIDIAAFFYYAFFYSLGNALRKFQYEQIGTQSTKIKMIISGFSFLIIVLFDSLVPDTITLCDYSNYWLYTISSLAGSYLTIQMCDKIKSNSLEGKVLLMLGRNTMPILLFQWFSFSIIQIMVDKRFLEINNTSLLVISKFIIGITLPLFLDGIYKKIKNYIVK